MDEDIYLKNTVIKMNEKLKDVKWKEFEIGTLFELEKCKCSNASLLKKKQNGVPYVGATNKNNGVMYLVEPDENLITLGNCIVFVLDGEGSMGTSFYKSENFIGSTTLAVGYNTKLNRYTASFISTCSNSNRDKYNFGYKRNMKRLRRETIMLPINEMEVPDWDLMESFMREVEDFIKPKIEFKFHQVNDNRELDDLDWEEFFVGDLFEIKRGRRLVKKNQTEGLNPYISSTGQNNGVDNFIGNTENVRFYKNCLTIANSGSVGEVFYHPYEFVASDHVTHIKKKGLNKYQYLFLATTFKKIGVKYSFNREISDKRLKREKIMLPITSFKEPDWGFMEQYMKRIENEAMGSIVISENIEKLK